MQQHEPAPSPASLGKSLAQLVNAVADAVHARLKRDPLTLERARSRVLGVEGAAEYLGVSSNMVRREANEGRLPHLKLGTRMRFSEATLERMASGEPLELVAHDNGVLIADRLTQLAGEYDMSVGEIAVLVENHARQARQG